MRSKVVNENQTVNQGEPQGKHVLSEFYGVASEDLTSMDRLEQMVMAGLRRTKGTCEALQVRKNAQNGLTIVAMLQEAHLAIHTFPEERALFLDIFSYRNSCNPQLMINTMAMLLAPERTVVRTVNRGVEDEADER